MEGIFAPLATVFAVYKYPLVFLGTIVEGPIMMVASGLLFRLGNFNFIYLYITLLAGDLFADILWYGIGRKAAEPFLRRFGHIFGVTQGVFERMEGIFRRNDTKILFVSKITMGFGFAIATVMAAGAMRVPFKKFITFNILGGFIWTAMLISVGYFLGGFYGYIADGFQWAFIVAVSVVAIAALYGFISFVRRKYTRLLI